MAAQKGYEVEGWPGSTFEFDSGGESDAHFEVLHDGWTVFGRILVTVDGLVISELCFRPAEEQRIPAGGVSVATLNLPVGRLRADVQRTLVKHVESDLRETRQRHTDVLGDLAKTTSDLADLRAQKKRGRRPYSDDELEAIARLYLDVQDTNGVDRIAEDLAKRLDQTVSTVNKKIHRATEAGFLGPAHQGRGGRGPGPRLAPLGAR